MTLRISALNKNRLRKTHYSRFTTDGSIKPKDALKDAARILDSSFYALSPMRKITIEKEEKTLLKSLMKLHCISASCSKPNWLIWIFRSGR
jgi:DNA-directed RNA polymerase alpha subunit